MVSVFFFSYDRIFERVNLVFIHWILILMRSHRLRHVGSQTTVTAFLGNHYRRHCLRLWIDFSVWTLSTLWVKGRNLILTHGISHVLAEVLVEGQQLLILGMPSEKIAETRKQWRRSCSLLGRVSLLFGLLRLYSGIGFVSFELIIRCVRSRLHLLLTHVYILRSLVKSIRRRGASCKSAGTASIFHEVAFIG